MKHLKIFETTAGYNAFKLTENFVTPNVSLCEDAPTIMHYEPYVTAPIVPQPIVLQHEYVEIAGIKWATMNIGANSITDTGIYFQWGDTQGYTGAQCGSGEGKKYFGWVDYKYGNGTSSPGVAGITKYNSTDSKTVLDVEDDAAQAAWGGQWRMPTTGEYVTLGNAVNRAWTADYQGSGVAGMIFTDKTDSSKELFFPACGSCYNGSVDTISNSGRYWSSSLDSSNVQLAYYLYFYDGDVNWENNYRRCYGFLVRGVLDDSNS